MQMICIKPNSLVDLDLQDQPIRSPLFNEKVCRAVCRSLGQKRGNLSVFASEWAVQDVSRCTSPNDLVWKVWRVESLIFWLRWTILYIQKPSPLHGNNTTLLSPPKEHITPTKQSKSVVHWIEDQFVPCFCCCSTVCAVLISSLDERGGGFLEGQGLACSNGLLQIRGLLFE